MEHRVMTIIGGVCAFAFAGVLLMPAATAAQSGVHAASTAEGLGASKASRSAHSSRTMPAALRPAFYRTLAKDASPESAIDKDGCTSLPAQTLKGCFDGRGASFTGAGSSLALHLAAFGREGNLMPMKSVHPAFGANEVRYVHGNLTEWWRALPMGFEQGFTIAKRPGGYGRLRLVLAANRHGADISKDGALRWGKFRYGKLVVTDANGQVVPATLKSKGNRILIAVNDTHAAYPLTVDPLVWIEQKVAANQGEGGDYFGTAVAVDGATALVGAPYATVNVNAQQGAVYVFSESDGVWTQTAKLVASDGGESYKFGNAVALSGSTAIVGDSNATVAGSATQGAVYIFTRSDSTWTQTAELSTSEGGPFFGSSVSLSGGTLLVGAPWATVGSNLAQGAAYAYTESEGTWTQAAKLIAGDGAFFDFFGGAVTLSGTTALVGASGADINGNNAQGAAYVFTESGGDWTQEAKLTASDGAATDQFGSAVALSDQTALVGATTATVKGNGGQGAAYVFDRSNGAWTQTAKLTAIDGGPGANFGLAVSLLGSTALVSAPDAIVNGDGGRGAAYVFTESNGTWAQTTKLISSDGAKDDFFGYSVVLDGATALIGARNATVGGYPGQGAAYFYGQSDLGLSVSAPQSVGQGQQYVSQTIATNNASAASPAVSATITVPAAASFVSATASQGTCNEASGIVTCDFGQIPGNAGMAMANVTLKATGALGSTIGNTAGIAKATPALTASAPTTIGEDGACPAGYTEFDGHLDAGQSFTSDPIAVTEAGQKYVDLTSPASFSFFAIVTSSYGTHTYVYPHAKQGHRWGAAGSYRVGVQAGPDAGGDYTLCVNLNPAQ